MRALIVKGTASNFFIQAAFAGLSFITATVLARWLGAEGFGAYSNGIAWANILSAFGMFGFDALLVREFAVFRGRDEWDMIKGLLRFSDALIISISMILGLIFVAMAGLLFSAPEQADLRITMWIAAPLVPLWALAGVRQSAMRGLEHSTRAMLPDLLFRPMLTLVLVVGAYVLLPHRIDSRLGMALAVASSVIALAIATWWLQSFLPATFNDAHPRHEIRRWLSAAPPMFLIGGAQILVAQGPLVILGIFGSAAAVGYFAVASRVARVLIFVPLAASIVMAPIIARLYSQGEKALLRNILRKTTRIAFGCTLLAASGFLLFGQQILGIFGPDFKQVTSAVVVLLIGYLLDSALGISIVTLTMTGHERIVAYSRLVEVLVLFVLCTVLVRSRGYEGAAVAFTFVMIFSRSTFALLAAKKTGINTTIL